MQVCCTLCTLSLWKSMPVSPSHSTPGLYVGRRAQGRPLLSPAPLWCSSAASAGVPALLPAPVPASCHWLTPRRHEPVGAYLASWAFLPPPPSGFPSQHQVLRGLQGSVCITATCPPPFCLIMFSSILFTLQQPQGPPSCSWTMPNMLCPRPFTH